MSIYFLSINKIILLIQAKSSDGIFVHMWQLLVLSPGPWLLSWSWWDPGPCVANLQHERFCQRFFSVETSSDFLDHDLFDIFCWFAASGGICRFLSIFWYFQVFHWNRSTLGHGLLFLQNLCAALPPLAPLQSCQAGVEAKVEQHVGPGRVQLGVLGQDHLGHDLLRRASPLVDLAVWVEK